MEVKLMLLPRVQPQIEQPHPLHNPQLHNPVRKPTIIMITTNMVITIIITTNMVITIIMITTNKIIMVDNRRASPRFPGWTSKPWWKTGKLIN